jgi:hypothetical protein
MPTQPQSSQVMWSNFEIRLWAQRSALPPSWCGRRLQAAATTSSRTPVLCRLGGHSEGFGGSVDVLMHAGQRSNERDG